MGAIHQALLMVSGAGVAPASLRFYFPNSGAADVSPTFGSGWNGTSGADRIKCVTTRIGSAMANKTFTTLAGTTGTFILSRQYVSAPLDGGTLSGTIKGQVRAASGAADSTLAVSVFVVSNDGSTVRGVAVAPAASELTTQPPEFVGSTTGTNRRMRDASDNFLIALTSVTVQAGDRLVIEIGVREVDGGGINGVLVYGDDNASDLPEAEDNTTTTALNPWIEFSSCPPLQ